MNKTWWLALASLFDQVDAVSGAATVTTAAGYQLLTILLDRISIDLGVALNFRVELNQPAQITVDNPVRTGGAIAFGDSFKLYVDQDATGGRPKPAFDFMFGADVQSEEIGRDPLTRSVYVVTFHDDYQWHLDSFITGMVV